MKLLLLLNLIFGILILGCKQAENKTTLLTEINNSNTLDDKEQIKNLIRQVLKWSDSKNTIDVLPFSVDSKDSACNGFDIDKLKSNLDQLRRTNFFSEEFIQNYNKIILTLDKKIKRNEFEKWYPNSELPPFPFANDLNPWCECQDNMDWNLVEIKIISLTKNKGELYWYWGNLSPEVNMDWKGFKSIFKVIKEEGKWKITYMHGFDF